jgi:aryl-alcohol dehydrogenase-like predicted oxidoreductase
MQSEGRCRRIGISAYAQDGPLTLARRFRPDVMQLPVSLFDQRLVADGTLANLADLGVEVHARSLFLQGLLFMAPELLPVKLAHAAPLLARRQALLADAGLSPLEAALGFALGRAGGGTENGAEIAVGIVGVTTVAELVAIVAAAEAPIPSGLDWGAFAIDDAVVLDPSAW